MIFSRLKRIPGHVHKHRVTRHHGCVGLLLVLAVLPSNAAGPTVNRIDPPSWWSSSAAQEITLLVEGANLAGSSVKISNGPAQLLRVEEGLAGRALFMDVIIPAKATPGPIAIQFFKEGQPAVEHRWELLPHPQYNPRTIGPDDVIYLVMPDRFANGDPSNNEPEAPGRMLDRSDPHAYHGGDFEGLRRRLPYLADLGVTALWLTPIYRPAPRWFVAQVKGKPTRFADFHGYSPVDFYDTNPRFGSQREYLTLVREAHRLGLKVIQDQIVGYVGPQHRWVTHPPAPDWLHGPIDKPPSCTFRYDALVNPHSTDAERQGVTEGWFFGILPDLNTSSPRLRRYAIQQSLWWTTLFEADGIRLDTYPLVERSFWRDWWRALQAVRPDMHVVGEAWTNEPAELCFFQGGRTGWDGIDPGIDMVFDFPLNLAVQGVFAGKLPTLALSKALAHDSLYPRPDRLVTFLDNHDTPRLAALPGVTPARLRIAAVFLLTMRGIPQLTWGDELGLPGHMDDRRDFPGGFPNDPRNAFDSAARTTDERLTFDTFRALLHLRLDHSALRLGSLTDLAVSDSSYVYLRRHEKERLLIALNLGDKPCTVQIPPAALAIPTSDRFSRLYGEGTVTQTAAGLVVTLPATACGVFQLAP